jgi:hypothetical protein
MGNYSRKPKYITPKKVMENKCMFPDLFLYTIYKQINCDLTIPQKKKKKILFNFKCF